jgi:hypothetical protein
LDIGPGSTVQFRMGRKDRETATDSSSGQQKTQENNTVYVGQVIKLSIAVNANDSSASTTFQLGGVRPLELNTSEAYSTEEHPLYNPSRPFTGTPLSDDFVMSEVLEKETKS